MRSGDLLAYLYLNGLFNVRDAILFKFRPETTFLRNSTRVGRTDGPMDGRTDTPSYRDASMHLKRKKGKKENRGGGGEEEEQEEEEKKNKKKNKKNKKKK